MRQLSKLIGAMTEPERQALAQRCGVVTIEGHGLSVHNTCMVWYQNPAASVVGGFRQWLNASRAVRKGEHGITIWIPTRCAAEKADPAGPTDSGPADADPDDVGFVLGTVFDIGQTDPIGEPALAREAVA